jgi:hypothetical protein
MRRRALLVLALVLVAPTLVASAARADGDPASDWLLTYQVFYPYYSNTPKGSLKVLQSTVADANKRGYHIRVAVITSPYDLGSVSSLWHKPQPYARFLAIELSFAYKGRLLIVSPNGYGYNDKIVMHGQTAVPVGAPAKLAVLRSVAIGKGTDGLLQTADAAVRALAKSDGYTLTAAQESSSSSSISDTLVIGLAAGVAALLLLGGEFLRRVRRRRLSVSAD